MLEPLIFGLILCNGAVLQCYSKVFRYETIFVFRLIKNTELNMYITPAYDLGYVCGNTCLVAEKPQNGNRRIL